MDACGAEGSDRVRVDDAIASLAKILRGIDGEVVLATVVDDRGFVGDSECFVSHSQPKNLLPVHELFHLASELGASGIMIASRSSGPIEHVHECDVDFTARVLDVGRHLGIRVCEHVLVDRNAISQMTRSTPYLWEERGMLLEREPQPSAPPEEDTLGFDEAASGEVPGEGADRQGDPEPGEETAGQSERARK